MCWLSVFENVPASKPFVISCVIYEVLLLSVSSLADSFNQKKKKKVSQLTLMGCSLNKSSRIKGGKNRTNFLLAKVPWLHVGGRVVERQWEEVHSALSRSCRNNCP